MSELKIGMIGLDTSHVTAFVDLLNDKSHEFHVPGCQVVKAFPGGSAKFSLSANRVEGFTKELSEKGILLCGTGIGISIAANKIKGIRAAVCNEVYCAKMAKCHNNANIITMGGRVVGEDVALEIVSAWLDSEFMGGRHQQRIDKITNLEKGE